MNVLSLFDGISCGRVALERSGVPVANYYASEIDPHAITISKKHYPDTIHVGDVTKLKGHDLPQIDIILAGSPCQGFSHNGAQLGFEDPRSQLFWEFVRLVEECQPTWWLLENVRMKKEWSDIITDVVGHEPILINSALVSAQRRTRLYWTNIPQNGLPADKGLVLKDILEKPFAEEQPMTDTAGKAYCLTATYSRCGIATTGETYESEIIHNTARHQRTCIRTPVDKSENWRMLTPKECERLQTLPDDYTAGVSNMQRYKALGNGWTIDVIVHLIKSMT
jgi:site-specific DNA-cytosine methylase